MNSPVYNVRAISLEKIRANAYNPNAVAPPEMKLLELSIWEDGYTMPIVCYYVAEDDVYEIVDGKAEPVNEDECLGCESCVEVCEQSAITIEEV